MPYFIGKLIELKYFRQSIMCNHLLLQSFRNDILVCFELFHDNQKSFLLQPKIFTWSQIEIRCR